MKNFKLKNVAFLSLILVFAQSCSEDDDTLIIPEVVQPELPKEIIIDDPGLYPTKFDFNPTNNKFVAASLTRSNVGHIDPQTGNYSVFVKDENIISVPEVCVDKKNNRLLVSSGDIGVSANSKKDTYISIAYLGVYDLKTGEKIKGIFFNDLLNPDSSFLPNGIAVSDDGDIYVADTFSPVIYKVDGKTYEKSVFVNDELLAPPGPKAQGSGLIGLLYVNDFLIASKEDDGTLIKIPLANPKELIKMDTPIFPEAKGLELLENGNIALVVGGRFTPAFTGVRILSSSDNWNSAEIVSSFEINPVEKHPVATTIANDGNLYAINSFFPDSFSKDLTIDFSIVRVETDNIK